MLGIIIGVATVVTMVTLGDGATAAVRQRIQSLGSNVLLIRPGQSGSRGAGGPPAELFEMKDAEMIRQQIDGIVAVAPQAQASVLAVNGGKNWTTTAYGTTVDFPQVQGWTAATGRFFDEQEESAGKMVCVLGATVAAALFPSLDPIGRRIRVQNMSCAVVGVLERRGARGNVDQDDVIMMPIKAVQIRFWGNRKVRSISVAVDSRWDANAVRQSIEALLRERRYIERNQPADFNITDSAEIANAVNTTGSLLTGLVVALSALSLVVGGIGIMNVMMVSVAERSGEIGIRLAVGALRRDILAQITIEAVTLSGIGGLIGLLIALIASSVLTRVLELPFLFDPGVYLLAFAAAVATGIAFGYWPASRAASLNPIDAIRRS